MHNKYLYDDEKSMTPGKVMVDVSFLLNGTGTISLSATSDGSAARGDVAALASVAYASATGKYTVTCAHPWRWLIGGTAQIQDDTSSDGARATIGAVSNENSATGAALTFVLWTMDKAGTLTNYTSRRCSLRLVFKNSLSGV